MKALVLKAFFIQFVCCTILSGGPFASAATVTGSNFGPADLIKLESLSVKCAKPGVECPRLPLEDVVDIVYIQVDDEYFLNDNIPQIATENGLLVSYKISQSESSKSKLPPQTNPLVAEINSVEIRFFPMSKVQLSPDSEFYMCAKGQEFSLDFEADLSSVGLTAEKVSNIFSTGYEPMSFTCKCFWAPKNVFDELGIEKYDKGPPKPDFIDELVPELPEYVLPLPTTPNQPWTDTMNPWFWIFYPYGSNYFTQPNSPSYPYNPSQPNNPTNPYHPPTPQPPIAPVGSPCGMFQFKCIYDGMMGLKQ